MPYQAIFIKFSSQRKFIRNQHNCINRLTVDLSWKEPCSPGRSQCRFIKDACGDRRVNGTLMWLAGNIHDKLNHHLSLHVHPLGLVRVFGHHSARNGRTLIHDVFSVCARHPWYALLPAPYRRRFLSNFVTSWLVVTSGRKLVLFGSLCPASALWYDFGA